ncbi:MAG: GTP 3',8-cyclase MoaA [Nitrospirae bacterium]|nr:GTP 3',8-cyclase MoaA [Nitrospirota bacterium]
MFDRANRKIEYLRISITDRCNLRCVYCMPEDGVVFTDHEEILSYEEVLRVVNVATRMGISKVRLTGGEPLVRKGVAGLIREIALIPGIDDLSLTTNGMLLGRMAGELWDAGLRRINISLDSLNPDTFRELTRGAELSTVLDGIAIAESMGFGPIKINVVAIRGLNDSEIEDFARLTLDKPYHVRFIEFMPIGARALWDDTKVVPTQEVKDRVAALGALTAVKAKELAGPATLFRLPGAQGIVGFISPVSDHFCGVCNRLRLTADGKLRPCLFSESEIDLKTPMRAGCDDTELDRLFSVALSVKPEGHGMADGVKKKYQRTMSKIGG